jgi:hypothetical protein
MQRLRDEGGFAAIFVALTAVAVFAMGAVVVDIAALLQEKRVLQNGADASALAIAEECGAGDCGTPDTTASNYADANADDGASAIEDICGDGVTGVPDCADRPDLPAGAQYVRVSTSTEDSGGDTLLPYSFARLIGFDGGTVHTRATAAWGGPSPADYTSELPIVIGQCEYERGTQDGFAAEPFDPADLVTIYLHDPTEGAACTDVFGANADLPGGFGWLDDPDGDCQATANDEGEFAADTGNSGSGKTCLKPLPVGTIVHMPIFESTNDENGANGAYVITGVAAFYITGYRSPGVTSDPAPDTCSPSQTCLTGYFVQEDTTTSGKVGGPSMGVVVVQLVQ